MAEFERIEYGTNTRPGGVVRSSQGDYFSFESDRKGLLVDWTTTLTAGEALDRFIKAFPQARPLEHEAASIVGVVAQGLVGLEEQIPHLDPTGEQSLDPSSTILDLPTSEAIRVIRQQRNHLTVAKLGFRTLNLTWHRPYARFVDSDLERAEVGIYTRDYSLLPNIRQFARSTGPQGFFDAVPVTAQIREHGNVRHVRI